MKLGFNPQKKIRGFAAGTPNSRFPTHFSGQLIFLLKKCPGSTAAAAADAPAAPAETAVEGAEAPKQEEDVPATDSASECVICAEPRAVCEMTNA